MLLVRALIYDNGADVSNIYVNWFILFKLDWRRDLVSSCFCSRRRSIGLPLLLFVEVFIAPPILVSAEAGFVVIFI